MLKNYIKLLRINHYIKNILVLVPLACSGQLFNTQKFISGIWGGVTFSLISSAVYIINDINDRKKDSLHPTKCHRPIASGLISIKNAIFLASILFVISISTSILNFDIMPTMLVIIYFCLNIFYSFGLKNIPIVDITILAAGFLIRVFYGALITGIEVSNWLYLTILTMSFSLAFGKRRNELKYIAASNVRLVLRYYPENFLDKFMYVCLGLTNVFYAFWCIDEKTVAHYGNDKLIFTVPLILLITMKYSLNIESQENGDPVEIIFNDAALSALCVCYFFVMFMILYVCK